MRSMIRRGGRHILRRMSYCRISQGHPWHGPYHDREYGFPIRSDAALLERLALEINQAGLSWLTMLQARGLPAGVRGLRSGGRRRIRRARVPAADADAGIIRNRLKINAVIENARRMLAIRESHGSFAKWLDAHHPRSAKEWQRLFKKTFVFTGGEIVGSFLLSTGYLRGAHVPSCPVYAKAAKKKPAWIEREAAGERNAPLTLTLSPRGEGALQRDVHGLPGETRPGCERVTSRGPNGLTCSSMTFLSPDDDDRGLVVLEVLLRHLLHLLRA